MPPRADHDSSPLPPADGGAPAVLLVDDRPANLLALEAILSDLPIRIVRATSGRDALRQLLKQDFALVLLDVQMPDMSGFETAAAIKAHPRTADVPIIFVTAINRDAAHVFQGYERGAVDYVLKPFEPAILRAKVLIFVDLYRKSETIKTQAALLREREVAALERRSEQRYQRLAEAMPLILWAAHPDGHVYYANRAWSEYAGGTVVHVAAIEAFHPDDAKAASAAWSDAQARTAPFEIEARLLRRWDERYRWHLVRGTPQHDDRGALDGWIVTATEIHAQKLAEEGQGRLYAHEQLAREAAEAANRAKDEFLANVSHELRAPLNSILGWAQMLGARMLDASQAARAIETIERSAKFQAALIEDIVDMARVKSGKLRLRAEEVNLVTAATAAVESFRPAAQRKKVELALTFDPPAPIVVGDPDRLQQIVGNLVSNAIKFTPESGKVTVAISMDGDEHTRIRVTDTGAGIAPEFLPHVFDRFRQADNSSTRRHQGLGLGLSIVHALLELHGGTIEARSDGAGRGATFEVCLPLRGRPPTSDFLPLLEPGTTDSKRPLNLDGLKVLFVDDDPEARELFTTLLEGQSATVVAVDSLEAAIATLTETEFHVLVSDLRLPPRHGYELIRHVRDRERGAGGVPAIAVSAFARADDRVRAMDAGFQALLSKPVNAAELVALVASLGETRRHEVGKATE